MADDLHRWNLVGVEVLAYLLEQGHRLIGILCTTCPISRTCDFTLGCSIVDSFLNRTAVSQDLSHENDHLVRRR